jgi:hypothetical protein
MGQVIVVPAPQPTHSAEPGLLASAIPATPPEGVGALGLVTPVATRVKADSATVTGRVTSEAGTPVGGAIVAIPNLRLSATTNDAGVYRIQVPSDRFVAGPDSLRVTRLGLPAGDGTVHGIVRARHGGRHAARAGGVARAGRRHRHGRQSGAARTAAVVATIDASQVVKEAPVTSVTQLLGARVPGVVVTDGSGTTGGATAILIRGAASISLSNQPLVFIDGVRVDGGFRGLFNVSGSGSASSGQAPSTMNDLNPNDSRASRS